METSPMQQGQLNTWAEERDAAIKALNSVRDELLIVQKEVISARETKNDLVNESIALAREIGIAENKLKVLTDSFTACESKYESELSQLKSDINSHILILEKLPMIISDIEIPVSEMQSKIESLNKSIVSSDAATKELNTAVATGAKTVNETLTSLAKYVPSIVSLHDALQTKFVDREKRVESREKNITTRERMVSIRESELKRDIAKNSKKKTPKLVEEVVEETNEETYEPNI